MKKYKYEGFYGDTGTLLVHNDGSVMLTSVINGSVIQRKRYKTLRGAKSALGRMSDCYTLTEV